jgi:predicted enzyme related to lactoylglutathione lyase
MLPMREGMMLGLWRIDGVAPASTTLGGGGELCAALATREAVDALHADWLARGVPVLQPPTAMDFGYTFTAADPDGHRIRVFHPAG